MSAPHADPSLFALSNPLAHPLHFFGLELVVFTCFALTLRHAIGLYRKGDRYPLFQWLAIFAYGVLIELLAFNYLQNYNHGQFTIQLYHRELPLYVTAIYVVFHYTGLKLIERLQLAALPEALLVGFMICLLDVPFDITGVDAAWWSWSTTDKNLEVKWLGVPITSYYWYLIFGAVFALLSRGLRRAIAPRSLAVYFLCAPLVGAAIIVLGSVAFLPFHGLKALGVPDGAVVGAHVVACALLALLVLRGPPVPAERPFLFIAGALYAWHVTLLVSLIARGDVTHALAKLAVISVAGVGTLLLTSRTIHAVALQRSRAGT
jgi:hypothetical protein